MKKEKKEVMRGWKVVVRMNDGKLHSLGSVNIGEGLKRIYPIKRWNGRIKHSGPFAIFDNRKFARNFVYWFTDYGARVEIWKTKYIKSEDCGLWTRGSCLRDSVPQGTRFAEKFILVEKSR